MRSPTHQAREPHGQPVYAVAFNDVDAAHADVFATVGANWVSIYRLPASPASSNDEPAAAADKGPKRKPRHAALSSLAALEAIQTYQDDEDESFYCVEWGLAVGSDGALVAAAGKHRQIRLIDCHTARVTRTMQGHGGCVYELRFVPHHPTLLLSASEDESIRLWGTAYGSCLAIFAGQRGHRDAVLSLDVRHDGAFFASAGVDGTVRLWRLRDEPALQQRVALTEEAAPLVAAAEAASTDAAEAAAARARELAEAEEAVRGLQEESGGAGAASPVVQEVEVEVEAPGGGSPTAAAWQPACSPASRSSPGGSLAKSPPPPSRQTRHSGATPQPDATANASMMATAAAATAIVARVDDPEGAARRGKAVRAEAPRRLGAARGAVDAARAAHLEAKQAAEAAASRAADAATPRGEAGLPARLQVCLSAPSLYSLPRSGCLQVLLPLPVGAHSPPLPSPLAWQLPVGAVDNLHFDKKDGVSFYIDCVRRRHGQKGEGRP